MGGLFFEESAASGGANAFPLLAPAISRQWEKVTNLAVRRTYKKNELIVSGDAPCNALMYVYSGLVRCEHPGARGNLKICFYAREHTIFAEALAFHHLPTVASFFAASDCVIYEFSVDVVKNIIIKYPDLAFNLMVVMAHKIRLYSLHLENITLDDTRTQICKICYGLLAEGGALKRSPGVSHQELADILGVHRNTIVRAVHELKKEKIIKNLSKSNIEVFSMEGIEKYFQRKFVHQK